MARYTKVLKSLAHNAVGNKRIEAAAPAGQNYYVTGATLGGGPNYRLSLARNGGLGDVTVDLDSLVGGGGSPGGSDTQIQYNNGGSFGGASALTYDDANDRLGINVASPVRKLDVNSAGIDIVARFASTDNRASIQLSDDDTNRHIVTENNAISLGPNSSLHTNNLNIVGSPADVGLGTTSPNYTLDIVKNEADHNYVAVTNTSAGTSSVAGFRAHSQTADLYLLGNADNRTTTKFGVTQGGYSQITTANGNGLLFGNTQSAPIIFGTNDTERMRILSGGNVGIGTTTPDRPLDVKSTSTAVVVSGTGGGTYGVMRVVDTADTTALEVVGQRSDGEGALMRLKHESTSPDVGDYVGTISFEGNDDGGARSPYAYIRGRIRDKSAGAEDGSLYFQVVENNARTDVMTLSGTKVGIGTTSPAQKLYVSGGAATFDNGGSHSVYFKNAGSQYGAIDTYGSSLSIEATNEAILSGASGVVLKGGNYGVLLSPIGTSAGDTSRLRFRELAANGTADVSIKAPDSISSGIQMILPATAGTANQVLAIDSVSSGIMTLGFQTVSSGGGTFGGSLSSGKLAIGTGTDTIGNFVDALTEDNSIYIGANPASTTSTAEFNVGLGINALDAITTGDGNVAIGYGAGTDLNTGGTNTLVGLNSGENLTTGGSNNAFGYESLKTNTTGSSNVALGAGALRTNDHSWNTAVGHNAARVYTGHSIVALGYEVGSQNVDGGGNTLIGNVAFYNHTGGSSNTVIGSGSMQGDGTNKPSSSSNNTSIGVAAMKFASGSQSSVAIGNGALAGAANNTSNYNVAIGHKAASGTTGMDNSVIIGREAGLAVQDAQDTVGIGVHALYKLTTGDDNTVVGRSAGYDLTTESGNTLIGYFAGNNITAGYTTAIGYQALGAGTGGTYDVAIGFQAHYNGTGRGVFIGLQAGKLTTGNGVAIGSEAGETNTNSGLVLVGENAGKLVSGNAGGMTAVGHNASSEASGTYHTMVGQNAGQFLKGNVNTGVGYRVFQSGTNATHQNNTGLGYQVLQGGNYSVTNQDNVAIGVNTMRYASGSSYNVAIGQTLFAQDQTSTQVVSVGYRALSGTTSTTGTVAVGHLAARDLTTGDQNIAIGKSAMLTNTTNDYNIAIGTESMGLDGAQNSTAIGYLSMVAHSGDNNVAVGNYSLRTGSNAYNVAVGVSAMTKVSGGAGGVAIGYQSGYHPTGNYNTWVGYTAGFGTAAGGAYNNVGVGREALLSVSSGYENTVVGYRAMKDSTTGHLNVAIGAFAATGNTTGQENVAIGHSALQENQEGDDIVAVGRYALYNLNPAAGAGDTVAVGSNAGFTTTTGIQNVFVGRRAAYLNTTGSNAVIIGREAGYNNTTGGENTYIGMRTGYTNTQGEENTFVGMQAGYSVASAGALQGSFNTFIGFKAAYSYAGGVDYGSNVAIGHQVLMTGTNANRTVAIGNSAGVSGTASTDNVLVGYGAGSYANSTGNTMIGNKAGFRTNGNYNTVVGYRALSGSSSGDTSNLNVAIGYTAMEDSTSASENVAVGSYAGGNITTGDYNTAVGYAALRSGAAMSRQVAVGYFALGNYIEASDTRNTAVGMYAMGNIRSGSANAALGYEALKGVNDGANDCHSNTAIGREALKSITSADNNTALGYQAGENNTTGDGNVFLGKGAGPSSTSTASNELYIHNSSGTPLIKGDFSSQFLKINGGIIQNQTEALYLYDAAGGIYANPAIVTPLGNFALIKPEVAQGVGAIPVQLPEGTAARVGFETTIVNDVSANPAGTLSVTVAQGTSDVIYEGSSNSASATVSIGTHRGANKTFLLVDTGVWIVKA